MKEWVFTSHAHGFGARCRQFIVLVKLYLSDLTRTDHIGEIRGVKPLLGCLTNAGH